MYRVNMSYAQLQRYLALLLERGLLETVGDEVAMLRYRPTEKGRELLQRIEQVTEMLGMEHSSRTI
jgi:predicted transcriptional regulator